MELAPGFIAAELNLGISLLLAEQVDQELFCLESVLERDPHNLEALLDTGLALHLRGRLGRARGYFEEAVRLDEHNALAWFYLGALLHELNEPAQALAALHKALALNPMEIQAWVEVASIHEQAGRLEEAATALDRVRQYCFESGIALDRAGRYDEVFAAYTKGNQLLVGNVRRQDIDPVPAMFDHAARLARRAPVRTASFQQVAEPFHQRSAGRWLNYRAQLAPYLPVLRPFAEHYGYSVQT